MSSVDRWARDLVAGLDVGVRHAFGTDPSGALSEHLGVEVLPAETFEQRGDGGWCDGVSFASSKLVMYRPTHSARDQFTLCHEAGHLIFEIGDPGCMDWVADQDEPERVLEQLCDAVAALLLIPDELIVELLAGAPPSAELMAELRTSTVASRTACLIALARYIPCEGFAVAVAPDSDLVFHASRTSDTRPYPWRGDRIPDAHPLRRPEVGVKLRSWWPDAVGTRRVFYQSTYDDPDDGWRYALFAANDLWGVSTLHIDDLPPEDRGYDGHVRCHCGYRGPTRWYPCETCGESQCPKCGECACQRRDRTDPWVTCTSCGHASRQHNVDDDGWCVDCCRDFAK